MQKNIYYRTVFRRTNRLKAFFLDLVMGFASYARLLVEVFIRKNFGERYFSIASVLTVTVLLGFWPIVSDKLAEGLGRLFGGGGYDGFDEGEGPGFWSRYATWYIFLIAFLFFSFLRWKETKRNPSVFDFARFSLYTGDVNPLFSQLSFLNRPSIRMVETIWEPLLFLIIGIVLKLAGQSLGTLLVISSIFYSLSYVSAYNEGDNFIMDKIDEMILNEEMESTFIGDEIAEQSRGVRFYARKPNSKELREQVADSFIEDAVNDVEEDLTEAR